MSPHVKEFLADIEGHVEATSSERLWLWSENHKTRSWQDAGYGYGVTVGHLDGLPVVLLILKATVDGMVILFWHPTSMVVDYRQIEAWFKEHLPEAAKTDAMNFHNIFPRKAA
jgi:hypothetical protein